MHPDTGRQFEYVQQKAVEDLDRIADAVARSAPNGANHGRFQASGNPASPVCRAPHSIAI